MAADNVGMVRRAFDAYAARDVERLLGLLAPDVEVRSLMTEPERTIYRGHTGAREWLTAVLDVFPDWLPTPQRVHALGDVVVVEFHVTATAARSGVAIDQTYWHALRLRGGKIVSLGFFRSQADALEAMRVDPADLRPLDARSDPQWRE